MDASLRPARRFDYNDTIVVGARPIPRVMRPAMDTISVAHGKPVVSFVEIPALKRRVEPVRDSASSVRPTLHANNHPEPPLAEAASTSSALDEAVDSLVDSDEEQTSVRVSKRTPRPHLKRRLGLAVAVVLVIGVIGVFIRPGGAAQSAQVLAARNEAEAAATAPKSLAAVVSEEPPANYLATYQVGKMQARIITISTIGVESRVIPVGVDGRGQPQLPTHSYDTGWYNVSARPGESGAVVVSGACSTEAAKGVFEKLSSVNKGDSITVERGDGARIDYSVKEIYRSPVDTLDMTKVLSPFDPKAPGLSLVTCDGTYDSATNDSADRLVIRAVQI